MNLSATQYMALWAEMEAMRKALERIAAASEAMAWPISKPRTDCPPGYEERRG